MDVCPSNEPWERKGGEKRRRGEHELDFEPPHLRFDAGFEKRDAESYEVILTSWLIWELQSLEFRRPEREVEFLRLWVKEATDLFHLH